VRALLRLAHLPCQSLPRMHGLEVVEALANKPVHIHQSITTRVDGRHIHQSINACAWQAHTSEHHNACAWQAHTSKCHRTCAWHAHSWWLLCAVPLIAVDSTHHSLTTTPTLHTSLLPRHVQPTARGNQSTTERGTALFANCYTSINTRSTFNCCRWV
jgi:hypothetical protein